MARFESVTGIGVLETYGMTEAASQITANPLSARDRRPGSVGLPVGIEVRVVSDGDAPVAAGVVGNVQIRGIDIADSGWLATGDLGWFHTDGFLSLVGRADDVINRGGEKLYPGEIEDVLLSEPRVKSAVVVGRHNGDLGEVPIAFVVASVDRLDAAELVVDLERRCATALADYKRPVEIIVSDALPAGPTGKVRRSELRKLETAS
jgi:acyl-CoA synthetase (AMP-forming)/AMP-acid ligase II